MFEAHVYGSYNSFRHLLLNKDWWKIHRAARDLGDKHLIQSPNCGLRDWVAPICIASNDRCRTGTQVYTSGTELFSSSPLYFYQTKPSPKSLSFKFPVHTRIHCNSELHIKSWKWQVFPLNLMYYSASGSKLKYNFLLLVKNRRHR